MLAKTVCKIDSSLYYVLNCTVRLECFTDFFSVFSCSLRKERGENSTERDAKLRGNGPYAAMIPGWHCILQVDTGELVSLPAKKGNASITGWNMVLSAIVIPLCRMNLPEGKMSFLRRGLSSFSALIKMLVYETEISTFVLFFVVCLFTKNNNYEARLGEIVIKICLMQLPFNTLTAETLSGTPNVSNYTICEAK